VACGSAPAAHAQVVRPQLRSSLRHCHLGVLLVAAACHPPPAAPQYPTPTVIGVRHPPLPTGYSRTGGFLLGGPSPNLYSLQAVTGPRGREVWLDRLIDRDSLGKARWEVRGILIPPPIGPAEELAFLDCALDGKPNVSIIAIGRWTTRDSMTTVHYAWFPNLAMESFDSLPAARVTCGFRDDRD
jgi:hypothetical protein